MKLGYQGYSGYQHYLRVVRVIRDISGLLGNYNGGHSVTISRLTAAVLEL